jgi:hypothetical protein
MCTKLTFFKLFIDMIINYYFKGISSALDGLNKFFKIHNKYRREHFMFRTIYMMSSRKQIFLISKM